MDALSEKPNQVLRLRIERRTCNGLIVSMTDENLLVATTLKEKPEVATGTLVEGEVPKPDGLYHFTSRVVGFQLMPMLVFILDRPKTIRKIQRRTHDRYETELQAQIVFVSTELSINEGAWVVNLSMGGMLAIAADAPPVGYHCMVLIQLGDHQLAAICSVVHSEMTEHGVKVGLAFTEMSRDDHRMLRSLVHRLSEEAASGAD
jgi:c-di-GMP-binding flagellar brake protein YcgR